MGVYIPNMDKPKGCLDCPVNDMVCELWTEVVNIKIQTHKDCPLIEIDEQILETAIKLAKLNRTMAEVEANEDKYIESNADQDIQCVESVGEDGQEEWIDYREEQEFNDRWERRTDDL